MTVLLQASALPGLPVVSIADGEDVAEVRDVIYDGDTHSLIGFTLNKRGFLRGRMKERLSASGIRAVGPEAVMIGDDAELSDQGEVGDALASPATGRAVIGNRVLSADGVELGTIKDVVIVAGTDAHPVGYELAAPEGKTHDGHAMFVPIDDQLAVSGDSMVVPVASDVQLHHDLASFAAEIDRRAAAR